MNTPPTSAAQIQELDEVSEIELRITISARLNSSERDALKLSFDQLLHECGIAPTRITCRKGSTVISILWENPDLALIAAGTGVLATAVVMGFGRELGKKIFEWISSTSKRQIEANEEALFLPEIYQLGERTNDYARKLNNCEIIRRTFSGSIKDGRMEVTLDQIEKGVYNGKPAERRRTVTCDDKGDISYNDNLKIETQI